MNSKGITMPLITPLHKLFAARVSGLDLTRDLDDAIFAAVRDAFERFSVLVFPGQTVTDEQQMRFSERFGPLEATRAGANGAGSKLIVLTNIAADGQIGPPSDKQVLSNRANQIWHTNSSFKPMPALASLLSAREIPSQAATRNMPACAPPTLRCRTRTSGCWTGWSQCMISAGPVPASTRR